MKKYNKSHKVQCLDAIYDEARGFMVLNLLFIDKGEKKLVPMHKQDFLFKGKPGVPDIEMIRVCKMFKGKTFNLVINDDPKRTKLNQQEEMHYAKQFQDRMHTKMSEVAKGIADDEGQISRKLYRMGKEGKLNVAKMYDHENQLRERLGF